ncbi:MAG: NADH-quinone oxidoreductase subunit NuoE [Alphaproteobacteria bacterium]
MSVFNENRPVATGAPFAFNAETKALADKHIAKYPAGRQQSAVMPLLDLAQRQNGGWLSKEAIAHVADVLGMPVMRVYEVASFYTMYNLSPVGKHVVQVCTTTPCWLRGSSDVVAACEKHLGIGLGETTADGQFTLREVECLGACVNAPVVQIADDYYEDVAPSHVPGLMDALKRGETPKAGSQTGRVTSAPEGGPQTLKDIPAKQGA